MYMYTYIYNLIYLYKHIYSAYCRCNSVTQVHHFESFRRSVLPALVLACALLQFLRAGRSFRAGSPQKNSSVSDVQINIDVCTN